MPDRTVIEWDKDDLDALGLLKVDVLGLGMLSAIRRAFDLINAIRRLSPPRGPSSISPTVPSEDTAVYEMICRADTVGVFQIESRAQMSMLPRLRPQNYYDLVIEVAIVRPGPIQGEMVHPYLRRRNGEEAVSYPSEAGRGGAQAHLGRAHFPGAGHAAGDRRRRLLAGRSGRVAPRDGGLEAQGRSGAFPAPIDRRHARARVPGELRATDIQSDTGVRRIWISGSPCGELRTARVHLRLAETLRARGILRGAHQQPADGLLSPAQLVRDARAHGVEVRPVAIGAATGIARSSGGPMAARRCAWVYGW